MRSHRSALACIAAIALWIGCADDAPWVRAVHYRSTVLATPIEIPGDPRQRSITSIEIASEMLPVDRARGALRLDERAWDIDALGDARPRAGAPPPAETPVELVRVADPLQRGKGRVLYELELRDGSLPRRIYFSWSGGSAAESFILVRSGDDPAPLDLAISDHGRGYVGYRHVIPMTSAHDATSASDGEPQGDSVLLASAQFDLEETRGMLLLVGDLGVAGRLTHDRNSVAFTPFGAPGMGTLIGYRPTPVTFVPKPTDVPDARGRRLFELQGATLGGAYRLALVLAPGATGHRLIVEREGEVRHVLPLSDPTRQREAVAEHDPDSDIERRVLRELRDIAGDALRFSVELGRTTAVSLERHGCRADAVARLADLAALAHLTFSQCPELSPDSMAVLVGLPELKALSIEDTPLSDAALAQVARLSKLGFLRVSYEAFRRGTTPPPRPTQQGIATLAGMPPLRSLQLRGIALEDSAVEPLGRFRQLTDLLLHNADMTRAGAARVLGALPQTHMDLIVAEVEIQRTRDGHLVASGALDGPLLRTLAELGDVERLLIGHDSELTDEDLLVLARMPTLQKLGIRLSRPLGSDVISALAALPRLRDLSFDYGNRLSAADLLRLRRMTQLEKLGVPSTSASPTDVAQLMRDLPRTRVTVGSVDQLEHQPGRLRTSRPIHDSELAALLQIDAALKELRLTTMFLSDEGIRQLATLDGLETLEIFGPLPRAGAVLEAVSRIRSLRTLVLNNTQVTDTEIFRLHPLQNLTRLELYLTQVTDTGVAEVQAQMPGCTIVR